MIVYLVVEISNVAENVSSVTIDDARPGDEWVLDFFCFYHIGPHRDWFTTNQSINVVVILNPLRSWSGDT